MCRAKTLLNFGQALVGKTIDAVKFSCVLDAIVRGITSSQNLSGTTGTRKACRSKKNKSGKFAPDFARSQHQKGQEEA